jgi:ribonuclease HI
MWKGFFRDEKGKILKVFVIRLGHNTNNVTELDSLVKDIHITYNFTYNNVIMERDSEIIIQAIKNLWNNVIMEGDSKIIIQAIKNLWNGAELDRVSKKWHLSAKFTQVTTFFHSTMNLIPQHVCKQENSLVNRLANEALSMPTQQLITYWDNIHYNRLRA